MLRTGRVTIFIRIERSARRCRGLSTLLVLIGLCVGGCEPPTPAVAPDAPPERSMVTVASARTLFNEAKALAAQADALKKEGRAAEATAKYTEAIERFEAVDRLDHTIIVTRWLAECYQQVGRRASAYVEYSRLVKEASEAGQTERRDEANERLKELGPVEMLTVVIPSSLAGLQGLRVDRDGEVLPKSLWGTPVPVDVGKHVITVGAPTRATWSETVTITERSPPSNTEIRAPATLAEAPWSTFRVAAVITGISAVVVGGVATGFGIAGVAQWNETIKSCDVIDGSSCFGPRPNAEAVLSSQQRAFTYATISNIGFSVGTAALVGAGVLWFAFPRYAESPASMSVGVLPVEGGVTAVLRGAAPF